MFYILADTVFLLGTAVQKHTNNDVNNNNRNIKALTDNRSLKPKNLKMITPEK